MKCFLQHKNEKVFECEFDEESKGLLAITEVYSKELVPLGIHLINGHPGKKEFSQWLRRRSVPATRKDMIAILEKLNMSNIEELLLKGFGLSLTDHYWLKPKGADMAWEDVNFFQNEFSGKFGELLQDSSRDIEIEDSDLFTPNSSVNGNLLKWWEIIDGKRLLFKGGSGQLLQEPYNEVFTSAVYEMLDCIPFVKYTLSMRNQMPYSVCENFVASNTELVSCYDIVNSRKKSNNISYLTHFIEICKSHGLTDIEWKLSCMLAVDFIIGNTDRHLNNLGIIRDADTLDWIGLAPVYDSGNSLWNDYSTSRIKADAEIPCKSFYSTQTDMMKHLPVIPEFEPPVLEKLPACMREIFKQSQDLGTERISRIWEGLEYRIQLYKKIQEDKV